MVKKNTIFKPDIPKALMKFFDKYDNVISKMFSIVKTIKPNIVDSYYYSKENPPVNPKYKYTEKLYIGCIFWIIKYGSIWDSFIGPIPGKQLNKRHHEYLLHDVYDTFFNKSLQKYLRTHKLKYLSLDATVINNKYNIETVKHIPINKNRRGLKESTIVDDKGSPLTKPILYDSAKHDSAIAIENIDELLNNKLITDALKKTDGHTYFLADSAYDSKNIRDELISDNIIPIIQPNNRRTKDRKKLRRLNKKQYKKYKKRLVVENFFAIIKKHPKINCVYEKQIYSFQGLLTFLFGSLLLNRSIIK